MLMISSRKSGHFFMTALWSARRLLGISARARCARMSMWHFTMDGLRFQNGVLSCTSMPRMSPALVMRSTTADSKLLQAISRHA